MGLAASMGSFILVGGEITKCLALYLPIIDNAREGFPTQPFAMLTAFITLQNTSTYNHTLTLEKPNKTLTSQVSFFHNNSYQSKVYFATH
jgi:ATP-dependent protease ClpP protease subunit